MVLVPFRVQLRESVEKKSAKTEIESIVGIYYGGLGPRFEKPKPTVRGNQILYQMDELSATALGLSIDKLACDLIDGVGIVEKLSVDETRKSGLKTKEAGITR